MKIYTQIYIKSDSPVTSEQAGGRRTPLLKLPTNYKHLTQAHKHVPCTIPPCQSVSNHAQKPHLSLCIHMACCSSECVLTFLYAGDTIQYVNEQFVSCIHFLFFCTLHSSSNPINKNLTGLSLDILVAS